MCLRARVSYLQSVQCFGRKKRKSPLHEEYMEERLEALKRRREAREAHDNEEQNMSETGTHGIAKAWYQTL